MSKLTSNKNTFVESLFSDEPVALVLEEHEPSNHELDDMEAHIDEYLEESTSEKKYNFSAYELEMIDRMVEVLNRESVPSIGFENIDRDFLMEDDFDNEVEFSSFDSISYDEELNFD